MTKSEAAKVEIKRIGMRFLVRITDAQGRVRAQEVFGISGFAELAKDLEFVSFARRDSQALTATDTSRILYHLGGSQCDIQHQKN